MTIPATSPPVKLVLGVEDKVGLTDDAGQGCDVVGSSVEAARLRGDGACNGVAAVATIVTSPRSTAQPPPHNALHANMMMNILRVIARAPVAALDLEYIVCKGRRGS